MRADREGWRRERECERRSRGRRRRQSHTAEAADKEREGGRRRTVEEEETLKLTLCSRPEERQYLFWHTVSSDLFKDRGVHLIYGRLYSTVQSSELLLCQLCNLKDMRHIFGYIR
ncbi:hypothetical protein F2P81_014418 [Scophthalmus maximus]|uniref:Uncharacterized protein n=1 Tax=Scophthalmus maximus TaxID=52904 RepID=A0A6A4SWA9_SCOMX|nr:hypothetical protein F2P81_014418 [Scophthalmus maximus]